MKTKLSAIVIIIILLGVTAAIVLAVGGNTLDVLDPKGMIAQKQRDLIVVATLLMLIVVVPVFILTFYIAYKYRDGNTKAKYKPNWDHNLSLEMLWWGLPFAIILALSIIIWKSSHDLDPYKPLVSDTKPLTIQVVALQWKWLFIYPEQNIATVNYIRIPEDTPINFEITADAPMNSFWIPQLGGQVYAMAGMETKLHLIADEKGVYRGSSVNLSGEGFSGMRFTAQATSTHDFEQWVASAKSEDSLLDTTTYASLANPSKDVPPLTYSSTQKDLYDTIIMKYMGAKTENTNHEMSSH